uniref:Uncharacterized protein n=1 Tax=Micrurus surinamensis TaxID=129470 RepID=A0A2D4NKU0_MICSU
MSLPPCSQQKEAELVTPDSSHLQTFGGLLVESCHQPEILQTVIGRASLLHLFLGHLIDSRELLLRINGELTLNDPMHFREPGGGVGGVPHLCSHPTCPCMSPAQMSKIMLIILKGGFRCSALLGTGACLIRSFLCKIFMYAYYFKNALKLGWASELVSILKAT